ncbi:MAG: hypothetical protein KDA96_22355, partial [Planctomycetaceae bacterium]|nr:hypothetical protein [Planctomycetaceae bacterium]
DTPGVNLSPGLYRIQVDTQAMDALELSESTAEMQRRFDATELSDRNLSLLMQVQTDRPALADPDTVEPDPESVSTQVPRAQIQTIPEVIACRFEYFDGANWLPAWTGDQAGNLPAAVRVTVDVASLSDLIRMEQLFQPVRADASAEQTGLREASVDDTDPLLIPARRYSRTILLQSLSAGDQGGLQ